MKYDSLKKLHYIDEKKQESIYAQRFNAPMTRHFEFSIRQYDRRNEYPVFLCYTEELGVVGKLLFD